jgi:ferrochelatase
VIPISFVSDHVETLYEIDLLYGEQAKKLGFRTFARAPNRSTTILSSWTRLADLVEPRLR